MDINAIAVLTERLGFPALVLIGIGIGIYRAGVWFQPRVDKVVDATASNSETLKVMAATHQINHESVRDALKGIREKVDEILTIVGREEAR